MNTKEKILEKALEMFNERGIEYVGLRELAAVLQMRVSNITYYFPTKDDLVYALSLELREKNSEVITKRSHLTMTGFLQMQHRAFQNQVQFRCLLLSVVHLMKQNKHMAAEYRKTQTYRTAAIRSNLHLLADAGYLNEQGKTEIQFLVSGISLISRFWISEAAISVQQLSITEEINHYLTLIIKLLQPYATAKAKSEMQAFLQNL